MMPAHVHACMQTHIMTHLHVPSYTTLYHARPVVGRA